MSLQTGSRIGRIRIDALIGAGGMGEVYRGWDERLERPVAVKSIQPSKVVHDGVRARFLREARLLSKLDHPNICRIYDVIEDESGSYLVLELIEGKTLRRAMQEGVAPAEAVRLAQDVARVLAFAHERGIMHRDLKPDNIMITASGEVKVLDFGLARLVLPDDADTPALPAGGDTEQTAVIEERRTAVLTSIDWARTSAGTLVGTLHYMSPEQARGAPLSAASDVYSLGVVLYELLCHGRSPYGETPSTADLLAKVRKAEVELGAVGDRDVARAIRRMTESNPADRPSASEVARELAHIRARPERRRRNAIVAAGVAALVLVAATTLFFARRVIDRPLFKRGGGKIAVLPFRNETHQRGNEWIELGLMDMVMQGLGGARGVQLVPADDVLKAMKSAGITRGAELTPQARARLLDMLGADTLLAAVVDAATSGYTIRYRFLLRDAEEPPREVAAPVVTDAANELAARLVRRLDPSSQKIDIRDRYSFDEFANVAYAIGVQQLLTKGPRAAEQYFTVCIDRDPEFAWAKLRLAGCHIFTGEVADIDALLNDAEERARRKGDRKLVAAVLIERAAHLLDRGDTRAAEAVSRSAVDAASATGDPLDQARAQRSLGMVFRLQSKFDEATRWTLQSARSARAARSAIDEAMAYNNLGTIEIVRHDLTAARRYLDFALQTAERGGNLVLMSSAVTNLSWIAASSRDAVAAERYARQAIELGHRIGDGSAELDGYINLGIAVYMQGREEEGIAATEKARELAAKLKMPAIEANALVNLGYAHTAAGRLALAKQELDAGDALRKSVGAPSLDQLALTIRAYWLIRMHALDAAERTLDEAERLAESKNSHAVRARLLYERREYRAAADRIHRAHATKELWLPADQRLLEAIEDAVKTGKPSSIPFEHPVQG